MALRIVMAGAVDFSRVCLETLIRSGTPLAGVLALPPGRARRHSDYADIGAPARQAGIPVAEAADINGGDALSALRAWRPDVLLVLGWSQLVGPELLGLPRMGAIGSHPALLPRNRGRHPIVWQLIHEEPESGLSLFWLDESADSGPILLQDRFPLSLDDDAGTFYRKTMDSARTLLPRAVKLLESGHPPRIPQDPAHATILRKRTADDSRIEWRGNARGVYNLVRALTRPYVGASARLGGRDVIVWRARRSDAPGGTVEPGTIVRVGGGIMSVATGDGTIDLLETDPPVERFREGDRFDVEPRT